MRRRQLLRGGRGSWLGGLGTVVLAGPLGACARSAPILASTGASFAGRAPRVMRANQIKAAGTDLGWVMEDQEPDLIRGTLNLRSHRAVVDIPYDQERLLIRYVSSTDLNYDGARIHWNYNSWVQRLERTIVERSAA